MIQSICLLLALLLLTPQSQPPTFALHVESFEYPRLAWLAGVQGDVAASVHIGSAGEVTSVLTKSGHQILRHAVEENLRTWAFNPGNERDVDITFTFKLISPPINFSPQTRTIYDLPRKVAVESNFAASNP